MTDHWSWAMKWDHFLLLTLLEVILCPMHILQVKTTSLGRIAAGGRCSKANGKLYKSICVIKEWNQNWHFAISVALNSNKSHLPNAPQPTTIGSSCPLCLNMTCIIVATWGHLLVHHLPPCSCNFCPFPPFMDATYHPNTYQKVAMQKVLHITSFLLFVWRKKMYGW